MSLPENFSPWEHLQSTLIRTYNQEVREEFSDLTDDDDLNVPRSSLRVACRITDDDSALQCLIRMMFFYFTVRRARDIQAPMYAIPTDTYQANVRFRPIVKLYFRQDLDAVPAGRRPVEAVISYRIRNEQYNTITEAELRSHALRIRTEFGTGARYVWTKGRLLVTYRDLENGINLQIYAVSKAEAIQVINKVLDCAQVPYDADRVVTHDSEEDFPANPGTHLVLGKSRPKPVRRPVANVRFQRATASIWGIPNDICLVDYPFRDKNPLAPL